MTGGGTGGHIYPALAVAAALAEKYPRAAITYVGTSTGMESDLARKHGLEFREVKSGGILGKSLFKAASGALKAGKGTLEAVSLLRSIRPSVVLGTGGYVSGPVVLAAAVLRIPRAIQEQNAVPGFTNRVLARMSGRIFAGFAESARFFPRGRVQVTGNPVRPQILTAGREESLIDLGLDGSRRTLFVFGGSRGAHRIVDAGVGLADSLRGNDVQILFVTGKEYYERASAALESRGIGITSAGNTILYPYLHNVEKALACADLVVCRAGGMAVAELAARGVPAILVPSPNVANNHQEYNARALSANGGALVVREGPGFEDRIIKEVRALLQDDRRLEEMRTCSRAAGKPRAAYEIAEALISMACP